MLYSALFSPNARLDACQQQDSAHVTPGDKGRHVALIQKALIRIEDSDIADEEMVKETYGPTTASAVLDYKTKRGLVNKAYQSKPDNIVGKMTITSLDKEVKDLEDSVPDKAYACGMRPFRHRFI